MDEKKFGGKMKEKETILKLLLVFLFFIVGNNEKLFACSYAIRKYDYFMQFCDMLFSKSEKLFLEKREIQSRKKIGKGILSYDKDFYIDPISVDTLYYLADQIDSADNRVFNDIFDIAKILIETDHADLSGTDFLYEKNPFMPSQTLLVYCINQIKTKMVHRKITICLISCLVIIQKSLNQL